MQIVRASNAFWHDLWLGLFRHIQCPLEKTFVLVPEVSLQLVLASPISNYFEGDGEGHQWGLTDLRSSCARLKYMRVQWKTFQSEFPCGYGGTFIW